MIYWLGFAEKWGMTIISRYFIHFAHFVIQCNANYEYCISSGKLRSLILTKYALRDETFVWNFPSYSFNYPFLGVLIPHIVSIMRLGTKLHKPLLTVMTDQDALAPILSTNGIFITAILLFSRVCLQSLTTQSRLSCPLQKKKKKEKFRLLNKPRRSISGIATSKWHFSLDNINFPYKR